MGVCGMYARDAEERTVYEGGRVQVSPAAARDTTPSTNPETTSSSNPPNVIHQIRHIWKQASRSRTPLSPPSSGDYPTELTHSPRCLGEQRCWKNTFSRAACTATNAHQRGARGD